MATTQAGRLRRGERVVLGGRDNRVTAIFPGVASEPLMTVLMVDDESGTVTQVFLPRTATLTTR